MCSGFSVISAATVSSWTLMLVRINAVSCGGSAPTKVGWMPEASLGIFVERNGEFLDQVVTALIDEIGGIFGEMLRAFGDEIAKPRQHLVAPLVRAARVPAGLGGTALAIAGHQVGIEVAIG